MTEYKVPYVIFFLPISHHNPAVCNIPILWQINPMKPERWHSPHSHQGAISLDRVWYKVVFYSSFNLGCPLLSPKKHFHRVLKAFACFPSTVFSICLFWRNNWKRVTVDPNPYQILGQSLCSEEEYHKYGWHELPEKKHHTKDYVLLTVNFFSLKL